MDKLFVDKLFISFNTSTVVLYLLAMEYNESPFSTIYIFSSSKLSPGIISCCPNDKLFVVKLFVVFRALTVIPYLFAIPYRVSPLFTMYVLPFDGISGVGIFISGNLSFCPIDRLFVDKLFNVFNSLTFVL